MLEYPRNVVWYVEVRRWDWPQSQPQMGSAVMVWLRRTDDPSVLRKFLLTCAHVLRARDSQGIAGYGAPMREILCWQPGFGYSRPADFENRRSGRCPGALTAKLSKLTPLVDGDVPDDERRPALDWVLLEIMDPAFADMEA